MTQTTAEFRETLKKWGMLTCTTAKPPLFSHIFKSARNKPLCPGFCYVGRFCNADKGKCTKAHFRGLDDIKDDTERATLISWVESQRSVDFAPGKGPAQPGS